MYSNCYLLFNFEEATLFHLKKKLQIEFILSFKKI
jgi:hypothetical protein